MWLLLGLTCLAIFCSTRASASQPHYVITVAAYLEPGAEEKVCVTWVDLKGPVDLKLELKKDDQVHIIGENKIDTQDHSECYSFKVPIIKEPASTWLLHVMAQGKDVNVDESKNVTLVQLHKCIIQTDKITYKPGETVKFRLLSIDNHFHATDKTFPLVEITDPDKHRITQWLDVSTNYGFLDFSFHLAKELSLGEYEINSPSSCNKKFKVKENVPKRFEVKLNAPSTFTQADTSINLEICGRYTYGKPVQGSVDLSICAKYWYSADPNSEEYEGNDCIKIKNLKTDSNGCVLKDINLGVFTFSKSIFNWVLDIKSSLREDETGHIEKASAGAYLDKEKHIQFSGMVQLYRNGFPYYCKVKISDEQKLPIPNKVVYLYEEDEDEEISRKPYKALTDENGIANFMLNTSMWNSLVKLKASEKNVDDDNKYSGTRVYIAPFYSPRKNLLALERQSFETECDTNETVTVRYDIERKSLGPDTDYLYFSYLLQSKDGILLYKGYKVDINDQSNNSTIQGAFPINFHVDASMFPRFMVLVFSVLPNGETIADLLKYEAPLCVNKEVQLKFSEEQVHPGATVSLEVSANAGSLCSVRSVGKGYLLRNPQDTSLLSYYREELYNFVVYSGLSYMNQETELERQECTEDDTAETDPLAVDVASVFRQNYLKVFTNTQMKKPVKCVTSVPGARSRKKRDNKDKLEQEHFTRRHFPDTWLFDLVPVGSDGHVVLNRTTPHSITRWVTDAFCLGKNGFASVEGVELTTFQPYFIDLIVPSSVVQGERFTIQALVFSFEKKCILIVVSLFAPEDLRMVKIKEQTRCVCEEKSHSFTWDVTAIKPTKTLQIHVDSGSLELDGECTEDPVLIKNDQRKDSVEKTIVVKPKGYEEEKTQTFLIHPEENKKEIPITLNLPERLVPGSDRAHVIIMGDLMANGVFNMGNMVHLPEGCAEQNVAKISRYVSTLEYLETVQELTPEIKAQAIEAMVDAYQQQLTYRTVYGFYGSFPGSPPNLWITALVAKAFISAKDWMYINEYHIREAVTWIQSAQLPDGCFSHEGYHFNYEMKADNNVARTAYILISLLEHPGTYTGNIVENALRCLRKSMDRFTSVYTMALLAYAFTLSGDSELRHQTLRKLDQIAVKKGGTKHWETKAYRVSDLEISSYVLLALLSDNSTIKHQEECADISRWIVTHQNPDGGFSSSQDTTVALQALAKYAKLINNKKGDSTVIIRSKSGFEKIVHVNKSNSLLVQMVDLPEITGDYTVSATGDGFVYVQSHLHYNSVPDSSERGYFSLSISTEPSACNYNSRKRFNLHLNVRYSGKRQKTNMVVILIEPVSGFIPDKNILKKLKQHPEVKRIEDSVKKVSIYLDELTDKGESFVIALEQETKVENLQPAFVSVYDYYIPDEHIVVEYSAPCSTG
ncbi:alpha-1-macroglobulin-like [Phyllobates terribilis]|uniref:alpha-1-macroglobulin-like n=1 Tax=Phyllobates terribilis TaxID=111132 RepID=UPI003CCB38F9